MNERRRVRRTPVYKCAKVSVNGSLHNCVVRDLSALGARLALFSTAYIPDQISLTFDEARTLRACRVAWRSSTEVGVEFRESAFRSAA
jgi:PilZ domain